MMISEVKIYFHFKVQFKKSGFLKVYLGFFILVFFLFNQMLKDIEQIYPKVGEEKPPDKIFQMFSLAWISLWAWLSAHLSG